MIYVIGNAGELQLMCDPCRCINNIVQLLYVTSNGAMRTAHKDCDQLPRGNSEVSQHTEHDRQNSRRRYKEKANPQSHMYLGTKEKACA